MPKKKRKVGSRKAGYGIKKARRSPKFAASAIKQMKKGRPLKKKR